ncbi:MAG: DMT family transporter [Deltaproteobacteria bacterium]|nr:DMT family transporter [Deltaproteobacteria bacterium]
MRGEFLAILSSIGWAADSILVRRGSQSSNIFGAAFLSYFVTTLCLWSYIALFSSLHLLWSSATIYFVLSGLLQPLLARILYYVGIQRLGVSRAGPLRGTGPLFAVIVAVIFLNERPNYFVYGGTILTVAGAWLILMRMREEGEWKLFDAVFPLGAALIAAVSQSLRRTGLLMLGNPFIGATITNSTSLIIYLISLLVLGKIHLIRLHRASLPYFGSAAFISAGSQILVFVALSRGEVSVMVPLFNTTPFFSVLFTTIFLRDLERVTSRVVIGAVIMVGGVIFIANR